MALSTEHAKKFADWLNTHGGKQTCEDCGNQEWHGELNAVPILISEQMNIDPKNVTPVIIMICKGCANIKMLGAAMILGV